MGRGDWIDWKVVEGLGWGPNASNGSVPAEKKNPSFEGPEGLFISKAQDRRWLDYSQKRPK